ncbi:MAG: hypothetical protein L6302_06645 [Desulfobacteraceae bacterium]|nr:hypothetical protein [Desulfobacteraceae bacterium]
MKNTKVVKAAFSTCILFSLLIGAVLLFNIKAIPEYIRLISSGEQIIDSVSELKLKKKDYLLYHQHDVLGSIRDNIGDIREIMTSYEKSDFVKKLSILSEFAAWEEAINLYERLFDQIIVYHEAIDSYIFAIRDLEKNILAVIYSKMNPERGIIALQEIRLNEKGFILYRNYRELQDEFSFEEKRREAVKNLLIWAQNDKRIEVLIEKDNHWFDEIISNFEGQENTRIKLKKEIEKIENMADRFIEEGNEKLNIIYRRCEFLCIILLIMWLVTAIPVAAVRFVDQRDTKDITAKSKELRAKS